MGGWLLQFYSVNCFLLFIFYDGYRGMVNGKTESADIKAPYIEYSLYMEKGKQIKSNEILMYHKDD